MDADIVVSWGVPDPRKRIGPINRPLVVVSHGVWPEAPDGYFEAQAWQATHLAAVSNAAAEVFGSRYRKHVRVVYNGAEQDRLALSHPLGHYRFLWGVEADQRVVLQIGRLEPEKQPDRLLRATKFLPPNWVVAFVGDGSLREECVQAAKKTGRKVIFQSAVPEVGDIYDAADVVCIPSKYEGMPLTMLESWLTGVPVVTTEFPVANEMLVRHGDVLSVVPQEHEPIVLAAALVIASYNDSMTVRAREVAEAEYTVEKMAARWDAFLLEALAENSNGTT